MAGWSTWTVAEPELDSKVTDIVGGPTTLTSLSVVIPTRTLSTAASRRSAGAPYSNLRGLARGFSTSGRRRSVIQALEYTFSAHDVMLQKVHSPPGTTTPSGATKPLASTENRSRRPGVMVLTCTAPGQGIWPGQASAGCGAPRK